MAFGQYDLVMRTLLMYTVESEPYSDTDHVRRYFQFKMSADAGDADHWSYLCQLVTGDSSIHSRYMTNVSFLRTSCASATSRK